MVPKNDAELIGMTAAFTLLRAAAVGVLSVWAILKEVMRRAADRTET